MDRLFFLAVKQENIAFILQTYFLTMEITFSKLLGEQLLEHNESNNEPNQISTNQLNGKKVGLYFASV